MQLIVSVGFLLVDVCGASDQFSLCCLNSINPINYENSRDDHQKPLSCDERSLLRYHYRSTGKQWESQCPDSAAYEGEHIREGEDKIGLIKRTVVGGPKNLFFFQFSSFLPPDSGC